MSRPIRVLKCPYLSIPDSEPPGISLLYFAFIQENEFKCSGQSGQCIPDSWVCDRDPDCKDASDEDREMCGMYTYIAQIWRRKPHFGRGR